MNIKKITANKWLSFNIKVENNLLTAIRFNYSFDQFWNTIIAPNLSENNSVLIQFKVLFTDQRIRSISYVQSVDINSHDKIKDNFNFMLEIREEEYNSLQVDSIIFNYKFPSEDKKWNIVKINEPQSLVKVNKPTIDTTKITGFSLPNTMDLKLWGTMVYIPELKKARIDRPKSKAEYEVNILELPDDKKIHNINILLDGNSVFEFKDTLESTDNLATFKRDFKDKVYYYKDGKLVFKEIKRKCKFLTKVTGASHISNKFLTLDIETRTLNGLMTPYCISIYDGVKAKSFYLIDYSDPETMLKSAIYSLMRKKYHQYKVYVHNFSHFDGVFLIGVLSSLSDNIRPIIRDGRIIDLSFSFGPYGGKKTKYKLYFRDSYLLLPDSLRKLAINFKVPNKGLFPYRFVNNDKIDLDYKGYVPAIKYFDNISLIEYIDYYKEFAFKSWDLQKETIKYCELDCIVLYKVIEKFNEKIFTTFRADILKYPTLSSLAFGIYRQKFLGEAQIPIIDGEMFNFFKEGYTGGAVDVYKPYGEKVYRYDVNSLYPHIMDSTPMPVGNPTYFEGDILSMLEKPFGIFEVEVIAPDNLNIPILQLRLKTRNGGTRTIAPIGNWTGVYFSEEIYNAMKYGYKFKVLRGYTFKKEYIFSDYVNFLYEMKNNSGKNTPDYTISKLLLNSLYGRLGMNPEMEVNVIVQPDEALKIIEKHVVTNIISFKNGKELISFFDQRSSEDGDFKRSINISIPISLAVTANARVHMSQFKMLEGVIVYYSDTDSIDINKLLDPIHVGKELGKMKLEHIFDKVVYLAPKVYGGKTEDYEYVKIKGAKVPVPYENLEPLLYKSKTLEISQSKWYRNMANGTITIKDELYSLSVTDNKRKLIYDSNNRFSDTSPLKIDKGKIED